MASTILSTRHLLVTGPAAVDEESESGSESSIQIPSTWQEFIEILTAKYESSFLANKDQLQDFIHVEVPNGVSNRLQPNGKERRMLLIGKIPIQGGLKMGIQGNRHSRPGRYLTPIRDGESIQDVLQLGSLKGELKVLELAWVAQINACREFDRYCDLQMNAMPIMDAPINFTGLIKQVRGADMYDIIEVLWEKFHTLEPGSSVPVYPNRNPKNVSRGAYYSPGVLEYGALPYSNLDKDVLVQHPIYDDHGLLVPPWETANELRPGSIVLVIGTLYERNIPYEIHGIKGYERTYEIRGSWAKVLKRGSGAPPAFLEVPVPRSLGSGYEECLGNSSTLLDYPGFKLVKSEANAVEAPGQG